MKQQAIFMKHQGYMHVILLPEGMSAGSRAAYEYGRKQLVAVESDITPWCNCDFDDKGVAKFHWHKM